MCMVTEGCALVGLEEVFVFMRVSDVIDAGFVWQGVFLCCPSGKSWWCTTIAPFIITELH